MARQAKTIATMTIPELRREFEKLSDQKEIITKQIEVIAKEVLWRVSRGRI